MPAVSRPLIESLVRESLVRHLGALPPADAPAPAHPSSSSPARAPSSAPALVVNASARHMHITQEGLETLFGPGHQLHPHKWLYQDGQFAAEETVTLIGPRKRIIPNLRILGPCRTLTQIELALTDAVQLGIDLPVRLSGDIEGTPGGYVMGPAGLLEMSHGLIRAARHVHMSPADADFYGVQHLSHMKLRVSAPNCTTTFEDLLVRVDPSFKLEVHIDTDEANACDLQRATRLELLR